MYRLFVALRPSREMRRALLDLMTGVDGARWQSDDQLHLTLRFVGEVDRHVAEDIAAALGTVDRPIPTVRLQGTGSFDHKGRPHSLWAGIAPDDALQQLQRRVDRALVGAGVSPEARAFMPHITMARLGRSAGPVEPFLVRTASLSGPGERCAAFLLYESRLGREGATYEPVARYPLT